MDEVLIQSMVKLHIRPELNVVQPKTDNDMANVSVDTIFMHTEYRYSKTCLKGPLKENKKIGFQLRLSLNAGLKYCRMLQGEHSAILSTFIKLPFSIKAYVCLL